MTAWQGPVAEDIVFLRYEFVNQSTSTMQRCYAGIGLDPDIGDGSDDMFGAVYHRWVRHGPDSIYVDHVAWVYDNDGHEPGWDTVGIVGTVLMRTPGNLGATAIKKFTIDIDPVTDPAQYLTLAGYDYRTGIYSPIDTSIDLQPADKRFLVASGPFDLAPGQTESLVVVIIGSTFWPESLSFAQELEVANVLYSGVVEERGTFLESRVRVWPNPFGQALWFEPTRAGAPGRVEIRDVSGRLVRALGVHGRCRWQGDDSRGRQVAPGVYLVSFGDERLKVVHR